MNTEQLFIAGSYYFLLNLGGAEAAGYFKECTGLTSESEVVSHEACHPRPERRITPQPQHVHERRFWRASERVQARCQYV